jgi:hypothetical protein
MFLSLANTAAGTEPFAVEPVAGIAGQAVPVSVHVPQDLRAADADGPVFVLFRDLPAEISFSAGFRTRLGWLVSVKDLGSLMLISSPGSFGVIEIESVIYRGRDQDHLSDRWRVDLTEPSPSSAEPTSSTRFDPGANLQRHQDRPSKLALAEVQELLRRADTLLHAGDFESARLIYSALADNGIAQAAILMAQTYDPEALKKSFVVGMTPDIDKAMHWYRRAIALGEGDARHRLDRLAAQK